VLELCGDLAKGNIGQYTQGQQSTEDKQDKDASCYFTAETAPFEFPSR
jgi:hypothetical protein